MERTIRRSRRLRLTEGILVLLLIGGGWWLWQQVILLRATVAVRRLALTQVPQELSARAAVERQLAQRSHDIGRLEEFVVARQQIGDVVGTLQTVGRAQGVDVRVANIEEEVVQDDKGDVVPPSGPMVDVRLTVVAYGDPARLTEFLYRAEHLPYLVRIPEWQILGQATRLPAGSLGTAPATGPQSPQAPAAAAIPGQLNASILLSVRYEKSET